jgi:hypothetical protein
VGGSGSIKSNNFDGKVDEIRVWGEPISNETFVKLSYDPGAYYGSSYSSSYENLYVDVSFSQPLASITKSVANETVYKNVAMVSELTASGFTTASYKRIVRPIRQYLPVVGSTAYTTRKVIVQPPPVFGEQFISSDGAYQLQPDRSIKTVEEKRYTSGQNIISFAVSPSDFINSNILRSMGGDINTNNLIGSPAKMVGERYTEIDSIFNYYLENYNGNINASQYINFYKNLIKAPTEFVETLLPARAKLIKGVTIESPILDRKRVVAQRGIRVDGTGTNAFKIYTSGSGSTDTNGMYSFDAIYDVFLESDFSTITNPNTVTQKIQNAYVTSSLFSDNSSFNYIESIISSTITPQSSTPTADLPPARQITQQIGNSRVSSSLMDDRSSVDFVDAIIETFETEQPPSSGYPRNPYLGIPGRLSSEENTVQPFYVIEPVSDFNDLGTTSYFIKTSGKYQLPTIVGKSAKTTYKTKLDIKGEVTSPYSYYDAPITLLPSSSIVDPPSRETTTISQKTYVSGSQYTGFLRIANIFSLVGVEGVSGLRFRLYADEQKQQADSNRPFTTIPTSTTGVLFDAILDGTPNVFPYTIIQSNDSSLLYFTVDNTVSTPIASEIVMSYFDYQPVNNIPLGYLPRHYKFSRTPWVAQARRNYLGCRIVKCQDDCPPDVTEFDVELDVLTIDIVSDVGGTTVNNPQTPTDDGTPRVPRLFPPDDAVIQFGGGGFLE